MSFKWPQNNVARIVIYFYHRQSNRHKLQKSILMSNNLVVFTDYNSGFITTSGLKLLNHNHNYNYHPETQISKDNS